MISRVSADQGSVVLLWMCSTAACFGGPERPRESPSGSTSGECLAAGAERHTEHMQM